MAGLNIKELNAGRGTMDRIMILLDICTGHGPNGQKDYFNIEKDRANNPKLREGEEITPVKTGVILELYENNKKVESYTATQITQKKQTIRDLISFMPQGDEPGSKQASVKIRSNIQGDPPNKVTTIDSRWIAKSTIFGGKPPTGPKLAPNTKTQETVTLKIFEYLLKGPGHTPPTNENLARDAFQKLVDTVLIHTWPSINKGTKETKEGQEVLKWKESFFLQYKEIRDTTDLPNNQFDVFLYDGQNSFMDFITEKVKAGPKPRAGMPPGKDWPNFGPISQKDSWNPADIWLVNNTGNTYDNYIKRIEDAQYIKQINDILIEAFKGTGTPQRPVNPTIAGISLKKASPGILKYELVNLTLKAGVIPDLRYVTTAIKLPFDKNTSRFAKGMGALLDVVEKIPTRSGEFRDGKKGKMRIGPGGGNDLNLEFGEPGAAAQLGKLPRDVMKKRLRAIGGSLSHINLPNATRAKNLAPKTEDDANAKILGDKIKLINSFVGTGGVKTLFTWDDKLNDVGRGEKGALFIRHMVQAYRKDQGRFLGDPGQKALIAMQVIEFCWILGLAYNQLGSREKFDNLVEDMYYYSQKKGKMGKSRFGPFGKLY